MREIHGNLFIGPQADYEGGIAHRPGWWVVHATKEPYHRKAVGYDGPDPPRGHPEYLFAKREQRLMLNLIDAPVEVDIPKAIFDAALTFIHEGLVSGAQVLVHCNQGVSRSASIGLLFLRQYTDTIQADDYRQAEEVYSRIYPPYSPGRAIRYFLTTHWREYGPQRKSDG